MSLLCEVVMVTVTRAASDLMASAVEAALPSASAFAESTGPTGIAAAAAAPLVVPVGPDQWFRPSGKNKGTQGLADFLGQLAVRDNAPLYVSETWGRATGGTNSDHHVSRSDSWALDVAVRGVQQPTLWTDTAARRIASALGHPNWTGGDLTKTFGGYRFQVLWRVPGHFNHVHVGVRKVA